MSLVYITRHNENIAAIEKHLNFVKLSRSYFSSKFKKTVQAQTEKPHIVQLDGSKILLTSSPKCKNRSMGYAETPLRPPCNYLRKHEGLQWRREKDHKCVKLPPQPVPRFERPKTPPDPKKVPNFVSVNIMKLKAKSVTRYAPRYVDTVRGDTHNLLGTGLVPQYVCRHNFGKVPCYLRYHKKHLAKIKKDCEEQIDEQLRICAPLLSKNGIRKMTDEERATIMSGLKKNFMTLYNAYQRFTLTADSLPKQLRKGNLEDKMRLLEQDMHLIQNNPVIYISNF